MHVRSRVTTLEVGDTSRVLKQGEVPIRSDAVTYEQQIQTQELVEEEQLLTTALAQTNSKVTEVTTGDPVYIYGTSGCVEGDDVAGHRFRRQLLKIRLHMIVSSYYYVSPYYYVCPHIYVCPQDEMQQLQLEEEMQRLTTVLVKAHSQGTMQQLQTRDLDSQLYKLKTQLTASEATTKGLVQGQHVARASSSDDVSSM